ncbi:MAG: Ig-like domain-containing protein [Bacilli bacterium]|nr:Ig-like domain-containing protein [Bacilli bacterium]
MERRMKQLGVLGLVTAGALAIGVISFSHNQLQTFTKGDASEYTLTLDSSNAYVSGSSQNITTDSGQYQVAFAYTSCINVASAHAKISDGGTILNSDHIRSISKLKTVYTGGTLKARTSYDSATWGEYFTLSSGVEYDFGSYPYYVELKATKDVTLTSAKFTYTCAINTEAHEGETPVCEQVLGVINFWNENKVTETEYNVAPDETYVDGLSYTDATFTTSADIVNSVSSTKSYQLRYGGLAIGSNTATGNVTLDLNTKFQCDKVVVKTLGSSTTSALNGQTIGAAFSKQASDLTNAKTLMFNYESLQSSISFTSSVSKLVIYQVYLYNTNSGSVINYNIPKDEVGFTATDSNKDNYLENSVFSTANGLTVVANYSDGTISSLTSSQYSYQILNSSNEVIDPTAQFGAAGTYTLVVSYKNYIPQEITLDVGEYVYLTGVTASMSDTEFTTAEVLSNNLSNNIVANKIYNYTSYNVSNIAYSNFATNHLEVKLYNPSDTEASISTAFGSAGTWKVRVISTEDTTKYQDISINVSAIKVTSVILSSTALDLKEGQSSTLTATVSPSNATDTSITWSSGTESVATVTSAGVVTAIKEGSAVITATANDGSGAKGTCIVTVSKQTTTTATITVSGTHGTSDWTVAKSDFTCTDITLSSVSSTKLFGNDDNSIKFGSSDSGGSLTLNFSSVLITNVKLYVTLHGSDSTSIIVGTSANEEGQTKSLGSTDTYLTFDGFANDTNESTSLTIASAKSKKCRFYLTAIELTIGAPDPVYPTAINLTGNSEIAIGASTTLSVTYTPSNTNQKYLSFTSSNTSVATVTDAGVVTGVAAGSATITGKALKADNSYASDTFDITVTEESLDAFTLLIYMCGADLESDSGLATLDLEEIASVSDQPDNVNIVVEAGGASSWNSTYSSVISASKLNRFHLENGTYVKDEQIDNASMGAKATFQAFMEWGLTTYPAEKTGLIMWNHGGALDGCCYDENYSDDVLTPLEFSNAMSGTFSNVERTDNLDWVAYDACLMAVQDIAEYDSHYFNYMLCSQESESGYGYDYDAWLGDLYSTPDMNDVTLLSKVAHTFMEEEEYLYNYWKKDFDQTQSVYDLSKMAAYKTAFETFAESLYSLVSSDDSTAIELANLIESSQRYGQSTYQNETVYPFDIFDVKDALTKIVANSNFSSLSSKATDVYTAITNLVVYEEHGSATEGCGICLFCPLSQFNYPYEYNSESPTSNFTNWKKVANRLADVTWE